MNNRSSTRLPALLSIAWFLIIVTQGIYSIYAHPLEFNTKFHEFTLFVILKIPFNMFKNWRRLFGLELRWIVLSDTITISIICIRMMLLAYRNGNNSEFPCLSKIPQLISQKSINYISEPKTRFCSITI